MRILHCPAVKAFLQEDVVMHYAYNCFSPCFLRDAPDVKNALCRVEDVYSGPYSDLGTVTAKIAKADEEVILSPGRVIYRRRHPTSRRFRTGLYQMAVYCRDWAHVDGYAPYASVRAMFSEEFCDAAVGFAKRMLTYTLPDKPAWLSVSHLEFVRALWGDWLEGASILAHNPRVHYADLPNTRVAIGYGFPSEALIKRMAASRWPNEQLFKTSYPEEEVNPYASVIGNEMLYALVLCKRIAAESGVTTQVVPLHPYVYPLRLLYWRWVDAFPWGWALAVSRFTEWDVWRSS